MPAASHPLQFPWLHESLPGPRRAQGPCLMREAWGRGTSCLPDSMAGRSNHSARAFAVLVVCMPLLSGTLGAPRGLWCGFGVLPSPPRSPAHQ